MVAAAALTHEDRIRACHFGSEKKVKAWLKTAKPHDIDELIKSPVREDDPGTTMLMAAVAQGKERLVAMLLAHNSSTDVQNSHGFTALHWVRARARQSKVRLA